MPFQKIDCVSLDHFKRCKFLAKEVNELRKKGGSECCKNGKNRRNASIRSFEKFFETGTSFNAQLCVPIQSHE